MNGKMLNNIFVNRHVDRIEETSQFFTLDSSHYDHIRLDQPKPKTPGYFDDQEL